MGILARLNESCTLMQGMADRLGVDLGAGMDVAPEFAATSFRSMVLACASCTEHDACSELQAVHPQLDATPDYCRNRDRFTTG